MVCRTRIPRDNGKGKGYLAPNLAVPKEAYDPADYRVVEIMKDSIVVPDLDDNVPSGFQPVIWDALFRLWANPDDYQKIAEELEKQAKDYYTS
ncbi:hypothetical protein [Thermococcus sp. LS2]|uniref:hypothetical protein n=1 Tax=Thermococcus sp. LS2 TaxID=1638260 RepID=UPI00143BCD20|nr:hypothetical protein [Thermococcus sp. LS2]NJE11984.1 hypothetical protein [Thermococcus sp. LS2]